MNVKELKEAILLAVNAKEKSDDETFKQLLQKKIEDLLEKVKSLMGKDIDILPVSKKLPQELITLVYELRECYSAWLLVPEDRGFFLLLENN